MSKGRGRKYQGDPPVLRPIFVLPSAAPTGDMRTGLPDRQTTPKDRLGAPTRSPEARVQQKPFKPAEDSALEKDPERDSRELRGEPHGNHY